MNPSIPALGYGADQGRTFLLAPIEGSSSTVMREMLGGHTHCRGNGTTPTAAVVWYMSSMAWTPGSPQWQPLGAIRAGCSLCDRQGQPAAPLAGSPPGPHCTCPFCGPAALGTSQGEWHHPCGGSLGHDQCGKVTPGSPRRWPPGLCRQVAPSATGGGHPVAPLSGSPLGPHHACLVHYPRDMCHPYPAMGHDARLP